MTNKLIEIIAGGSLLVVLVSGIVAQPQHTPDKPARASARGEAHEPGLAGARRKPAPNKGEEGEWLRPEIDEDRWGVRDTRMPEPSAQADEVPDVPGNLFEDASFERFTKKNPETLPWFHLAPRGWRHRGEWVPFELSEMQAHSGARSAHLHMNSDTQPGFTRVHGLVQELSPDHLPRYLSGWYYVDDWQRGATRQYIQTVVIARGSKTTPEGMSMLPNFQVAMVLAGVQEPPVDIPNRRFHFAGPLEPVTGEWHFFEFDLHQLFDELWGVEPEDFESMRIFFETRYDQRVTGPSAKADVYFDDLYLGDESRAPSESERPGSGD